MLRDAAGSHVFTRDGLKLSYIDTGGPGMPVVFQHGLCGDASQTAEVFPGDNRFRLITLECRGHGRSAVPLGTTLSIADFAGDLAALIEELGIAPVAIGGISMGAAIAERLAVRRPDLVRALILARPAWITAAAPDNAQPNAEVGRLLAEFPPAEARARFASSDTARRLAREAPDNLASLLGFFARPSPSATAALLSAIAADGPGVTDAELRNLALPTMVIGTANDAIHPMWQAEALAEMIPAARLVTITPKSIDRAAYVREFERALTTFLEVL